MSRAPIRSVQAAMTLLALTWTAGPTLAQGVSDRDFGTDTRQDRQRLEPATARSGLSSPPRDFTLTLTLPVLGTDNAVQTLGDETNRTTRRADVHFSPEVELKWSHQFTHLKVSAVAGANVDRFSSEKDVNEDTVFGSLKLSLTDGSSDLFVPYAAYALAIDYRPTFAVWDDTLHSLSAGFSSGIGFDAGGRRIAYRDAIESGNASILLDVNAGHRLAVPSDFANTFVVASVELGYVARPDLTFLLTPKLRTRWYDNYFGAPRRDIRLTTTLQAIWTPEWLTRRVRGAEIDFSVSFLRNISTRSGKGFSQWEGGPALVLSWKF